MGLRWRYESARYVHQNVQKQIENLPFDEVIDVGPRKGLFKRNTNLSIISVNWQTTSRQYSTFWI